MTTYIFKRLLAAVPVIIFTSVIIFILMRVLPGDPLVVLIGESQTDISPDTLQQIRHEYDLDQPVYVQYITWLRRVSVGDFGRSVRTHQTVLSTLRPRLLPTVQIGLEAWLFALLIGIPAGIVSATRPNSWSDWIGTVGALMGAAIPYFLLGGALIYIVALRLRWLPASGYISPFTNLSQSLKLSVLPVVTLGLGLAAITTRQSRASLIEVLHQGYIVTARAKGLKESRVIRRHALKNAMLPVVTILGLQLGNIFGGAVITETIFAIPGMGRLLVESIFSRDYPVVQAIVLLISVTVVLANLAVDIVYAYLDPRIRLS